MDFLSTLASITVPVLGLNWIDIVILTIIVFYAIEGYFLGFLVATVDLLTFSLAFIFGISLYSFVGDFFVKYFSISQGFANAIGFFVVAAFFEIGFNFILKNLVANLTPFKKDNSKNINLALTNSILGIFPGALSGIIIISFILSLIISLPFAVYIKHSVSDSKIGNFLVVNTQGFAKDWSNVFGGAVNDTLSFLTIEPKSNESVNLNFKSKNVSTDKTSEVEMFNKINNERISRGIVELSISDNLTNIARAHCKDMFVRGYFSHYTPEKLSPFDRMAKADIQFNYAGENLALAPNTELAMRGLMQSPGHKANILSTNFNRVGIGVIDGGIYGEMFCQEFTD